MTPPGTSSGARSALLSDLTASELGAHWASVCVAVRSRTYRRDGRRDPLGWLNDPDVREVRDEYRRRDAHRRSDEHAYVEACAALGPATG